MILATGLSILDCLSPGRVLGAILILLLVAGGTWARSAPERALFLARDIVWGPSDVWGYQKFPARSVNNAPPTFQFKQNPRPELFQSMIITYKQGGQVKEAKLVDLLKASQTTSFLVIKNEGTLSGAVGAHCVSKRTRGRSTVGQPQDSTDKGADCIQFNKTRPLTRGKCARWAGCSSNFASMLEGSQPLA